MKIDFVKYQGTGNDFVMLDNMSGKFDSLTLEQIRFLCDRKLGIGADGLIKLSKDVSADFYVDYFNADGSQSFCGNGARCSVAFAIELGLIQSLSQFNALDGLHRAEFSDGIVRLEMRDVAQIERVSADYFVDTGSPHYIHLKQELDADILSYGKKIRYSEKYEKQGVNVNYLTSLSNDKIEVETYERGVEDETLSCGTGVTACALVQMTLNEQINRVHVNTKGGKLTVEAMPDGSGGFMNIWLSGPAMRVFHGTVEI